MRPDTSNNEHAGFYSRHLRGLPVSKTLTQPEHTIECDRYFSGLAIPQRQILFGGHVDLLETLNRSRTILSVLVHICAFTSVVIACAYTFRALALVPFSFGALLGAIFYLVLLLIVWD
jgi:hypothetical protein